MSNQIQPAGKFSLAHQQEDYVGIAGFEQLTAEDFTLPRLVLVQAQHAHEGADKHMGEWYNTGSNEHIANPRILIIGIAKSRAMFSDQFSRDSKPICRSDNAIVPRHEFIGVAVRGDGYAIPHTCAECVFGTWTGDTPPECSIADNWAAITADLEPVVFALRGASYKVSKKLKTTARVAMAKRQALYIELGSQRESSDTGTYYVPTFTLVREAVPAEMLEMASAMNGVNLASRAAEMENVEDTMPSGDVISPYTTNYTDDDYEAATAPQDDMPF